MNTVHLREGDLVGISFPNTLPRPSPQAYAVLVKKSKGTLHVAGQTPTDEKGRVVGVGDLEVQIRRVFENLKKVLAEFKADLRNLVSITVYLKGDQADDPYRTFRIIRREYLDSDKPPALTSVSVSRLAHPDMLIEIQAIAEI
jgi:enamine deaminase RidA (YjgF/YER057c/UK114 family)